MAMGGVSDGGTTAVKRGELPSLTRRIEEYRRRIITGHTRGPSPLPSDVILCSNDYLALGRDPVVLAARQAAIGRGAADHYVSGAFLGADSAQRRFEQRLAAFFGAEDAVLCQSGWSANDGLLQVIADALTPVYIDILAHMSLWQGIHNAGARAHPFRHNSVEHLATLLARHGPGIVVVDSIYSAFGDVAPLAEIAALAARSGSLLVVDESHAVGAFGPGGRGLVEELGLAERVPYRTFSLSKAFVGRGGVVAGPARVLDFLRYESRPAVFSAAVAAHEVAGFAAVLDAVGAAELARARLQANSRRLRDGLAKLGYDVAGESQIIALETGDEAAAARLQRILREHGVAGALFCAPATPRNRALVRLTATAGLQPHELERTVAVCAAIRDEVGLADWPSSRRRAGRSAA
jgi:CAI-1 autoinducer synthase